MCDSGPVHRSDCQTVRPFCLRISAVLSAGWSRRADQHGGVACGFSPPLNLASSRRAVYVLARRRNAFWICDGGNRRISPDSCSRLTGRKSLFRRTAHLIDRPVACRTSGDGAIGADAADGPGCNRSRLFCIDFGSCAAVWLRARNFTIFHSSEVLTLLFLANFCFHLGTDGLLAAGEQIGLGIAIDLVMILIVIIGGRIIPAFTKSGLARQGIAVQFRVSRRVEIFSIASIVAVLLADLAIPLSVTSGTIARGRSRPDNSNSTWHGTAHAGSPDLGSPYRLWMALGRIAAKGNLAAHRSALCRKMDPCSDRRGLPHNDFRCNDARFVRAHRTRLNCFSQNLQSAMRSFRYRRWFASSLPPHSHLGMRP